MPSSIEIVAALHTEHWRLLNILKENQTKLKQNLYQPQPRLLLDALASACYRIRPKVLVEIELEASALFHSHQRESKPSYWGVLARYFVGKSKKVVWS